MNSSRAQDAKPSILLKMAVFMLLSFFTSISAVPPSVQSMVNNMTNDMTSRQMGGQMHQLASDAGIPFFEISGFIQIFSKGQTISGFGILYLKNREGHQIGLPWVYPNNRGFYPAASNRVYVNDYDRDENVDSEEYEAKNDTLIKMGLNPEAKAPQLSFVELDGKRFFPSDTDSLSVFGIKGFPQKTFWNFRLETGRINAFAYCPSLVPHYYSKSEVASAKLPDSASCFGKKELVTLLQMCPRAWTEAFEDPLMAVKIYNSASDKELQSGAIANPIYMDIHIGDRPSLKELDAMIAKHPSDYLAYLGRARIFCHKKRFLESEKDMDFAKSLDSKYYQIYWTEAFCLEMKGLGLPSVNQYKLAAKFAAGDEKIRKMLQKKIEKLEKKYPDTSSVKVSKPD